MAPSPGFEIEETAPTCSADGAIRYGTGIWRVQKAQSDIYTYAGRPGVEYLVTSEYDEFSGDIYDGKATAEYVER